MIAFEKYIQYLKSNNKIYYYFALGGFQPARDLIGDSYYFEEGIGLLLFENSN